MKRALTPLVACLSFAVLTVSTAVKPAAAQTESDLLRFEWISGLFFQGTMGQAAFSFDTTPFGGILVERDKGTLDVDPTFWYGVRTSYRLTRRWSVSGSWMHAQAQYRVQFPSLSRDEGNFDLEGLILGTFDFTADQNGRLASATSDARIDMLMASIRYEIPTLRGWAYPYVSAGTGIYRQKSDGSVLRSDYETDVPPVFQPLFEIGSDPLETIGVSRFAIDATDFLVTVGVGLRASLSHRWGASLDVEDLIQIGADFSNIGDDNTPAPDPERGQLFSTTFSGKKGTIHSLGIRIALNYAFWPKDRPR